MCKVCTRPTLKPVDKVSRKTSARNAPKVNYFILYKLRRSSEIVHKDSTRCAEVKNLSRVRL
jgi:hypothetical protein